MNTLRYSLAAVLGLSLLFPVACSGDDGGGGTATDSGAESDGGSDGSAGTGGEGGNGVTPCGMFGDQAVNCQAGQYCSDEVLNICENGCLSNTNCADEQTCEKAAGEDVGSCQMPMEGIDCADVCSKLQACDPSTTQEMCDQFCAGTNQECQQCVLDDNCPILNCDAQCGLG